MVTGEVCVHAFIGHDGFQQGAVEGAAADNTIYRGCANGRVHEGPLEEVVEAFCEVHSFGDG